MSGCKSIHKKGGHKALKIIGVILGCAVILGTGAYFYAATHTQIVVGLLQKLSTSATGNPVNSFDPFNPPITGLKENGQYLISEIRYGTEYPNSYLDIIYPNEDLEADRPTLFYFHGGGFFAGSKNMGDPMAASESTALLDDLCAQGYNIVNVDYALVPDCHFPVPLIQANQVFAYITEHKDKYHLNMDKVVIMGSSAGAIMASQLGSIITNPDYAALLGITPALQPEQVRAVVLDDAPLDYESFTLGCKFLIGNYVRNTIFLSKEEISRYNNILHVTPDYPAAILLGSEYRHDMNAMHDALDAQDVENLLIDPLEEHGEEKPHCFVANERTDPIAKEAFDRLTVFLAEKTGA